MTTTQRRVRLNRPRGTSVVNEVRRIRGQPGAGWSCKLAAIGREVPLLVFVLLLTVVAGPIASVYWAPGDYESDPALQWLIAGAALVPVVLRRRLPALSLLVTAGLFGWYPATAAAFALTAFTAVSRIRSWRRLAVLLGTAGVLPLVVSVIGSGMQWRSVFTAFGLGILVCVVIPGMLAVLLAQRERLVAALLEQTQYLQRNYELADSGARLQERSRIAGEMHDILGHRLSLISLYAGALELDAASSERSTDEAKLIRGTVASAMGELRRILGILREAGRDGSPMQPVDLAASKADLAELVAQSRAAGIPVDLDWSGDDLDEVAPTIRRAVHRIVREALTNVHRHAGGAEARVHVLLDAERVRVEVANGAGPSKPPAGHSSGSGSGLVGVQERVRLLGGNFRAEPTPDGGFVLAAGLPLHPGTVNGSEHGDTAPPPLAVGQPQSPAHRRVDRSPGDWWPRAAMAAVLSTGLGSTIGIMTLAFGYVVFETPGSESRPVGEVAVGMSWAEVQDRTGPGDPFIALAARHKEPPRAAGTRCIYQGYGPRLPDGQPADGPPPAPLAQEMWPVQRYCFRQNTLIDMIRFDLPVPVN